MGFRNTGTHLYLDLAKLFHFNIFLEFFIIFGTFSLYFILSKSEWTNCKIWIGRKTNQHYFKNAARWLDELEDIKESAQFELGHFHSERTTKETFKTFIKTFEIIYLYDIDYIYYL